MDLARVTVVIPVYNIEQHLRECLNSVEKQTLTDIEVICVDDGSTDKSPCILADYAAQDSRFQIQTQGNAGPGAARNAGMKFVRSKYLIFLDSDDWYEPDFLERMVARAEAANADVTVCRTVEFDTTTGSEKPSEWMLKEKYLPGEIFTPADVATHIFQFSYGWPWDKLYKAEFVKNLGLEYPQLPNSEDLVFVFLSLAMASKIAIVSTPLVHHRTNRFGSVSNSRHRNPEVPYQALMMLMGELQRRGVYHDYEQSFLNWAMEFLIWNVANMGDTQAQRRYFHKLKNEWLPEMAFDSRPGSYYEPRFIYYKYLLTKYAPWPIFFSVLTAYKWVREKVCHGGN